MRRLQEQDAWAIAMAWQAQLQGKVHLMVDQEGPIASIVESYAWIQIDQPSLDENTLFERTVRSRHARIIKAASIMRAAALTWIALSSCRGFSGKQNPLFWKKVLSAFQGAAWPPVTDAVGFFDQPNHKFPRFMVKTDGLEEKAAVLRTFCGVQGYEMSRTIAKTLKTLMAQLRPYVNLDLPRGRDQNRIDVCVSACHESAGNPRLLELVQDVESSATSSVYPSPTPCFRIVEIHCDGLLEIENPFSIDGVFDLMRKTPVTVSGLHLLPWFLHVWDKRHTDWERMWIRGISALLGLDGHGVQGKTASVVVPLFKKEEILFPTFASALPFARSPHTITFTYGDSDSLSVEKHYVPWIAYAIFHPQAKESPWKHFQLPNATWMNEPGAVQVWKAMARGNNLTQLMDGTSPDCDAYYRAVLPRGSVGKLRSATVQEEVVISVAQDLVVDVCGVTSLDVATWSEWVTVVIVAYGLVWVRSASLRKIRACAPSLCRLKGLSFPSPDNDPDRPFSSKRLLQVLLLIGSGLKYLNIEGYKGISSTVLSVLLRACPALTTLVVNHNGAFWSSTADDLDWQSHSPLQELDMTIPQDTTRLALPSLDHLNSSLGQLRALRLRVHGPVTTQAHQQLVCQYLTHALGLQFIQWLDEDVDTSNIAYNSQTCNGSKPWATSVRGRLGLPNDQLLDAMNPLNASCAAAFLSVIAHKMQLGEDTAMACLEDRDVLANIFQFTGSSVVRLIDLDHGRTRTRPPQLSLPRRRPQGGFSRRMAKDIGDSVRHIFHLESTDRVAW